MIYAEIHAYDYALFYYLFCLCLAGPSLDDTLYNVIVQHYFLFAVGNTALLYIDISLIISITVLFMCLSDSLTQ
jgi:hypothetical protein